ncbi:MAG: hypothetical protein FJ112_01340 [Deltaproteobacteria bacterium]|nr:hypothetical protein [Deltaproteobacteria bacterium]
MGRLNNLIRVAIFFLPVLTARGEFYPPMGPVGQLVRESQELMQVSRYVGLPFQVQQAVYIFNNQVFQLAQCSGVNPSMNMPMPGVPQQCAPLLQIARHTYMQLDQIMMRGGFYQIPQLYHCSIRVRQALMFIQVVGFPSYQPDPGYGPRPY